MFKTYTNRERAALIAARGAAWFMATHRQVSRVTKRGLSGKAYVVTTYQVMA
jgi:hypothetical protein